MARIRTHINHAGIAKLTADLQKAFDEQGPIRVPVEADMAQLPFPEFRRNQDQFLRHLYDNGATSAMYEIDPDDIANVLGLDAEMKDRVVDALLQDRYVDHAGFAGGLHLTSIGRRYVEQRSAGIVSEPAVVNNTTYITGDVSGQVATGPNATMHQTNIGAENELLRQLIEQARQLDLTDLTADERDDFATDVEILERQAETSDAVPGYRRAVRTIRDTAVAVAGSAGGQGVFVLAEQLLS